MSLIPYRRSFIVTADVNNVVNVLEGIGNIFKGLPYFKVMSETEKGFVCSISYRKRFSKLMDRVLLSIKRESSNTFSITIIGSRLEIAIYLRVAEEAGATRIDVNATARAEKTGLVKSLLSDLASRIEEYVRSNISAPKEARVVERKPLKTRKEREERVQPVLVPLTELRREEKEEKAALSIPQAGETAPTQQKPPVSKPSLPPREELEERMKDPLWIAQLLMNSSLITRKTMSLPSSPKELIDLVNSLIGGGEGLVMISIRGGDADSHIIYDPSTNDIKAVKTTIGGILDYTGEEALKKLFERKQQMVNIKIWSIKQLP